MAKPYTFAFSYSRWSLWRKCPKAYKYQHVDKVDTGPTPKAMIEGRQVHDDIAKYLEAKGAHMPDRLKKNFEILGKQLADMYPTGKVQVEKQMSFDREIKPVSWFSKESWARFIWDALVTDAEKIPLVTVASAVDWKTGKPYGSYDDQMQIFALPAFWTYPNLQTFTGHLLYLDTGDDKEFTITREQFEGGIERTWIANIKMMESDVAYPATPSKDSCKWCDFGRKNLGICEDWVG